MLPSTPSSPRLVGRRADEAAAAAAALARGESVLVVAPVGSGRSRLAAAVAGIAGARLLRCTAATTREHIATLRADPSRATILDDADQLSPAAAASAAAALDDPTGPPVLMTTSQTGPGVDAGIAIAAAMRHWAADTIHRIDLAPLREHELDEIVRTRLPAGTLDAVQRSRIAYLSAGSPRVAAALADEAAAEQPGAARSIARPSLHPFRPSRRTIDLVRRGRAERPDAAAAISAMNAVGQLDYRTAVTAFGAHVVDDLVDRRILLPIGENGERLGICAMVGAAYRQDSDPAVSAPVLAGVLSALATAWQTHGDLDGEPLIALANAVVAGDVPAPAGDAGPGLLLAAADAAFRLDAPAAARGFAIAAGTAGASAVAVAVRVAQSNLNAGDAPRASAAIAAVADELVPDAEDETAVDAALLWATAASWLPATPPALAALLDAGERGSRWDDLMLPVRVSTGDTVLTPRVRVDLRRIADAPHGPPGSSLWATALLLVSALGDGRQGGADAAVLVGAARRRLALSASTLSEPASRYVRDGTAMLLGCSVAVRMITGHGGPVVLGPTGTLEERASSRLLGGGVNDAIALALVSGMQALRRSDLDEAAADLAAAVELTACGAFAGPVALLDALATAVRAGFAPVTDPEALAAAGARAQALRRRLAVGHRAMLLDLTGTELDGDGVDGRVAARRSQPWARAVRSFGLGERHRAAGMELDAAQAAAADAVPAGPGDGFLATTALSELRRAAVAGDAEALVAVTDDLEALELPRLAAAALRHAAAIYTDRRQAGRAAACAERLRRLEAAGSPVPAGSTPARHAPPRRSALSRREREVCELVGSGLSNRAIAERLFLSVRTVESHVLQARAKLGAANRGELARLAAEPPAPGTEAY